MNSQPMKLTIKVGLAALAGLLLFQTGCSVLKPKADLTQFFVLRPVSADSKLEKRTGAALLEIRVGPGSVASYLETTPIVVANGPNRVEQLDLYHWAEPLPKGISRTLAEDLAQRLNLPHLTLYPDKPPGVSSTEVRFMINRFEGKLDGPVTLDVSWQIVQQPDNRVVSSKHSVYVIPAGPGDVASYVDRLSQALSKWAADVAAAIPFQ